MRMIISYVAVVLLALFIISGFYFMVNTIMLVYSLLKGSPFVKTKHAALMQIFTDANLKKGMKLLDLGCGDGIVVRTAAKEFGIEGVGVDVNFILIARARIMKHLQHLKNVTFLKKNIYDITFSDADVIYIFLLPKFLEKLKPKLIKEAKPGALIISHGFEITGWKHHQTHEILDKPFSTFFYRLSDSTDSA